LHVYIYVEVQKGCPHFRLSLKEGLSDVCRAAACAGMQSAILFYHVRPSVRPTPSNAGNVSKRLCITSTFFYRLLSDITEVFPTLRTVVKF